MSDTSWTLLPAVDKTEPAPASPPTPPPFVPKPPLLAAIYALSSVVLGVTQGLGLNLITSNLTGLQASFGATYQEMGWVTAAYFATNMTGTILMYKIRTQFGLRRFAEIGLLVYVLIAIAHLLTHDLHSAILVRAVMGVAAAPLSTLAFFYMLEWLPPAKKMSIGICFGLLGSSMSLPLARMISPELLQLGDWQGLYLVEVGLALVCLGIVFTLPITHPPRMKMFDRDDIVSFPLMAVGFACIAIFLSMGRSFWWLETPWLGVLLAIGIGSMVLLVLVELHRKNPMVDLRWLSTRDMLTFAGSLVAFRLLLSEQSVGVFGLFSVLNVQNDQLIPIFGLVGACTFGATAVLSTIIKPARAPAIHLFALLLIAIAAWLDSHSTALSRPEQFYVSQGLIGVASGVFLPPAMLNGIMKAISRGPQYILSFLTVFLTTQTFGGILGGAVFSSFVSVREQFHANILSQDISLLDPLVAQRVQLYGGVYSRVLTDPALRNAEGMALLGGTVTQQSYILAYNDLFIVIFVGTLFTIAALLIHMLVTALSRPAAAVASAAA